MTQTQPNPRTLKNLPNLVGWVGLGWSSFGELVGSLHTPSIENHAIFFLKTYFIKHFSFSLFQPSNRSYHAMLSSSQPSTMPTPLASHLWSPHLQTPSHLQISNGEPLTFRSPTFGPLPLNLPPSNLQRWSELSHPWQAIIMVVLVIVFFLFDFSLLQFRVFFIYFLFYFQLLVDFDGLWWADFGGFGYSGGW